MAAPGRDEVDAREGPGDHAQIVAEVEIAVGGLALIQAHAANLDAQFEGMAIVSPSHIVNDAVGGADFDVGGFVGNAGEIVGVDSVSERAGLGVMEGRAVDVHLGFVEDVRAKDVLEGQEVVGGMVEGQSFVQPDGDTDLRLDQALTLYSSMASSEICRRVCDFCACS